MDFHLIPAREHTFLTQSCLVYLMYYSGSAQRTSSKQDLDTFVLLLYAAKSWFYHATHQQWANGAQEIRFLNSKPTMYDWLDVYDPEQYWRAQQPFERNRSSNEAPLFYAGSLGIGTLVTMLIDAGVDIELQSSEHESALSIAVERGHEHVVQILLGAGADVNAQCGRFGGALRVASEGGHERVVQVLLEAGAEVNAQGGFHSNALQVASWNGHERVVQALLDAGADVNAQSKSIKAGASNALDAALYWGREHVLQMLSDAEADLNLCHIGVGYSIGFVFAINFPNIERVRRLLNAGLDINNRQGAMKYNEALKKVYDRYYDRQKLVEVVRALLDAGALVKAEGGEYDDRWRRFATEGSVVEDDGSDRHDSYESECIDTDDQSEEDSSEDGEMGDANLERNDSDESEDCTA